MGSEAQRNENVAVYQIDTNAVKEMNIRVGTTPTVIVEASPGFSVLRRGARPATVGVSDVEAGGGWCAVARGGV